ncbi:hypothetical protein [Litoribrevibacter albus]|uniref:Uncharacterized protein n=1 Tax=Litoribrevibacter albus TaxID=1473156 RepID=A0AA37SBT1_9GAMM|nr:hypothetical protein [Litoribrevibacter albus]GLQ32446.1 hypothetical protein GCM10007876_29250 [Litoribrevibacter albus]
MNRVLKTSASVILSCLFVTSLHAELVPVDDSELAAFAGQAMISIEDYDVVQADATTNEFFRVTLGATIETNATIDNLELGTYDRAGYSSASDIDIDNLRLGYIDPDTYEYVPFVITDPYMEFAFSESNGVRDVVGLRIGAGSVSGALTANINSLTGNFEIMIDHDGNPDTAAIPAQLLDSTGAATNIRATHLGEAGDCSANCISLNNLATLNINDSTTAGDMFLSYQNIDIGWAKTLNDGSIDVNSLIETTQGAFFNLPTGMTSTTDALIGVPGVGGNIESTRYTDAALGLFP